MRTSPRRKGARARDRAAVLAWAIVVVLVGPGGLVGLFELPGAHGANPLPNEAPATSDPTAGGLASSVPGDIGLVPTSIDLAINGSSAVPEPQPIVIGNAFVYPDLYAVAPAGHGSVSMSERSMDAPLETQVNFTDVSSRTGGVVGYPELQYGTKPWCTQSPCSSAPTSPLLPLPLRVSQLASVYPIASYSVGYRDQAPAGAFDLAYDLWLTRSSTQNSANAGDVEIMAWLDYNSSSILPGTPVGNFSIPTFTGTAWIPVRWDAYLQDGNASNPTDHWAVVYLILHTPLSSGTVALDLTGVIGIAGGVLAAQDPNSWSNLGQNGSRTVSTLELDDIELGSEFRPSSPNGPARYDWELSGYCLDVSPLNAPEPSPGEVEACGSQTRVSGAVGSSSNPPNILEAGVAGFGGFAIVTGMWYRGMTHRRPAHASATPTRSS